MWPFAALTTALALIFAFVASGYARRYALPISTTTAIYGCFLLLLIFVIVPGMSGSRHIVDKALARYRHAVYALLPIWCLPYLVYGAGTGDLHWNGLARLVFVALPVLLIYHLVPVPDITRFAWQDAAVAVWLILGVLGHALKNVWNVPVNLDFFGRLFVIALASWSWIFVRGLPDSGYDFAISVKIAKAAVFNFAGFAVIAIPAGLALHFISWNPRWRGSTAFFLDYVEIFLFIALLEELFFRGFLQNLISNSLGSWQRGQILAACLFGLFHILHAPFPNWRYIALATVAGWFYGSAYRQSGSLMASSLVHAAVDTVWRTWLTKAG